MKKYNEIRVTNNSRVYRLLDRDYKLGCPFCAPHKGCNKVNDNFRNRNWKKHRSTKWKEVSNEI